jgi:hypothetical protein
MKTRVFNLLSSLNEDTVRRMNNWLEENAEYFTHENKEYKLKIGDVITFKNGYGIPMQTKIIAFNSKTGNPYLYWDCYWYELDLKERLLKPKDHIAITKKILQLDQKASTIIPIKNLIIEHIEELNKEKSTIIGYRASCGTTDTTAKVYELWLKALKEFEKQGVYLRSEHLPVKNSYASNKGGFWHDIKYFF